MELGIARGPFAQFNKGITVTLSSGGLKLEEYVEHHELPDLVASILDLADDCLFKLSTETEYDPIRESVLAALNSMAEIQRARRMKPALTDRS